MRRFKIPRTALMAVAVITSGGQAIAAGDLAAPQARAPAGVTHEYHRALAACAAGGTDQDCDGKADDASPQKATGGQAGSMSGAQSNPLYSGTSAQGGVNPLHETRRGVNPLHQNKGEGPASPLDQGARTAQ